MTSILKRVSYDASGFRYAFNEDEMAIKKLAEGVRALAAAAFKL